MRDLDDYQQKYKDQPYERFQVYFRKKKIKEILERYKHNTILEVGCGFDPLYNNISDFEKLYIVEPGDLFYKSATEDKQKHFKSNNIFISHKLIEDCVEELCGIDFDFILISGLLHEVADPQLILDSVLSVAASQTVIHINVPNARSFHRLLAVEMGLIKNEFEMSPSNIRFQQHTNFDLNSLTKLAEQSGLRILESGSYCFKPFTHQQMEDMIQAKLITPEMIEAFYKMEKYLPGLGSEIYINAAKK